MPGAKWQLHFVCSKPSYRCCTKPQAACHCDEINGSGVFGEALANVGVDWTRSTEQLSPEERKAFNLVRLQIKWLLRPCTVNRGNMWSRQAAERRAEEGSTGRRTSRRDFLQCRQCLAGGGAAPLHQVVACRRGGRWGDGAHGAVKDRGGGDAKRVQHPSLCLCFASFFACLSMVLVVFPYFAGPEGSEAAPQLIARPALPGAIGTLQNARAAMPSRVQLKAAELLGIEAFVSTPTALVGALVARETLADLRSVVDQFNAHSARDASGAKAIGPQHGQWSQPVFKPDRLSTLFAVRHPSSACRPWYFPIASC